MTHSIKLAIAVATAGAFAWGPRAQAQQDPTSGGGFQFEPLPASAQCALEAEGDTPLLLPQGYSQQIIAREGDVKRGPLAAVVVVHVLVVVPDHDEITRLGNAFDRRWSS